MASFDEKVEALKRLRERRQGRTAATAAQADTSKTLEDDAAADKSTSPAVEESTAPLESAKPADSDKSSNPFALLASKGSGQTQGVDPAAKGGAGETDALFCAAHCHEHGLHGCEPNPTAAAELYLYAAEDGHIVSQWRLGELYEFGRGVPCDETQAAKWYRLSAEAGNAQAQSSLALLLEEGRGVELNQTEALRWHLAAAEQGHPLSQYCAACCLAEGRGCEEDPQAAHKWIMRSAEAGFQPALRDLEETGHGKSIGKDEEDESSLLSIVARVANQLSGLDDEEADVVLQELMAEVPAMFADDQAGNGNHPDDSDEFHGMCDSMDLGLHHNAPFSTSLSAGAAPAA